MCPYDEWKPDARVHRWVTQRIHDEMMQLLMMHRRPESPLSRLPKGIIMNVAYYIACRPERVKRQEMKHVVGSLERRIAALEDKLQVVLKRRKL